MECSLCEEVRAVERREQTWAIAKLTTGIVLLNPTQYFSGATFFVSSVCVREPFDLDGEARSRHLMEMAAVMAAVQRATGASKMNTESLGNSVAHLHWWITPRQTSDSRPRAPIWEDLDFLRVLWTGDGDPSAHVGTHIRQRILEELRHQEVTIEASYL